MMGVVRTQSSGTRRGIAHLVSSSRQRWSFRGGGWTTQGWDRSFVCSFSVAVIQHCDEKQLSEKCIWAYGSIGIRAIVAGKWQTWWQDRLLRAHILNTSANTESKLQAGEAFYSQSLPPVAYFLQQG